MPQQPPPPAPPIETVRPYPPAILSPCRSLGRRQYSPGQKSQGFIHLNTRAAAKFPRTGGSLGPTPVLSGLSAAPVRLEVVIHGRVAERAQVAASAMGTFAPSWS